MTDRRTALGSRLSVSQITANEKTYRRSPLVIHCSASARTSLSDDLKLWIASSSTASISARMPDQGRAACVRAVAGISVVGISKGANATCTISFIEVLPYVRAAPRRCRRLAARWGLVRVRVGAVVPRVRAGNVFTTADVVWVTTRRIDGNGLLRNHHHSGSLRPLATSAAYGLFTLGLIGTGMLTLPCRRPRGSAPRRTTRVVMRAYGAAVLCSTKDPGYGSESSYGERTQRVFAPRQMNT
jgi:hypothetical protein